MKDSILYRTDLIEIATFTVNPQEPEFIETGFASAPIIVFPKNSIWIQHAGSDPFVADPTLVNFYNQGQAYKRFAIHQSGDFCHWFRVSDDLLSEVVAKDKDHFNIENMLCPAAIFIKHLEVLKLTSLNNDVLCLSLEIEEQVLGIFHELLIQSAVHDRLYNLQHHRHKALVERVKESLHDDLSVNYSLQELSALHNTSPYHLSRVFKTISGQGISQYRKQQRLRSLTLELEKDDVALTDLAFDFGFSSHSHMSASFKQVFGQTPSDYQKQLYLP